MHVTYGSSSGPNLWLLLTNRFTILTAGQVPSSCWVLFSRLLENLLIVYLHLDHLPHPNAHSPHSFRNGLWVPQLFHLKLVISDK